MAIIKSGASSDLLTIDPTSKAGRITLYDSAGRELSPQGKLTYAAAGPQAGFTPPATPTDMIIIEGSATKTVRIISVRVQATATAAITSRFSLIKRSTADTTGTFVAAVAVPLDSNNAGATINRVGHFTANPGALGTLVGPIVSPLLRVGEVGAAATNTFSEAPEMMGWGASTLLDQPVTLRGVAQTLAVNFNGAALPAGMLVNYSIVWMEE